MTVDIEEYIKDYVFSRDEIVRASQQMVLMYNEIRKNILITNQIPSR